VAGYSGGYHYILFVVSYYGMGETYQGMGIDEGNHNHTDIYPVGGYI
jgi:hypothetical protein